MATFEHCLTDIKTDKMVKVFKDCWQEIVGDADNIDQTQWIQLCKSLIANNYLPYGLRSSLENQIKHAQTSPYTWTKEFAI